MCYLDDKWLDITAAELDHMIEQVQGIKLAKQVIKEIHNVIVNHNCCRQDWIQLSME